MITNNKKLVIISLSSAFGGGEKWCKSFAMMTESAQFDTVVIPFVHYNEKGRQQNTSFAWSGWSQKTLNNLFHLKSIVRRFESCIATIDSPIVLCATWPAALLCLYLKSRRRFKSKLLIVFHRQCHEVLFRSSCVNLLVPCKFIFLKLYLRYADKVVVLNESSQKTLQKWLGVCAEVIPNGIDITGVRQLSLEGGVGQLASPYLIFIGRFEKEKGVDLLIRSFATLSDCYDMLVLVGAGSLDQYLRSLAENIGIKDRVVFSGFKENPFPLLRGASALVVTSPWECQPLVVLEAFALEIPVVGVDNPGIRSLLGDSERGTVCPGNIAGLVKAIREVRFDSSVIKRTAAGKTYAEAHDQSSSFERYLSILEELLI